MSINLSSALSPQSGVESVENSSSLSIVNIPEDSIFQIISYLGSLEIENIVCVNKFFKEKVVKAAATNEPALMSEFIGSILRKISFKRLQGIGLEIPDSFTKSLKNLQEGLGFKCCHHLRDVRRHMVLERSKLMSVLGLADANLVNDILSVSTPSMFLKQIPMLLEMEDRISRALSLPTQAEKDNALFGICEELCSVNFFDLAFKVASKITDDYSKNISIGRISVGLCRISYFKDGVSLALGIESNDFRNYALTHMLPIVAKLGDFHQAEIIAASIPDTQPGKIEALRDVAIDLAEKGQFKKALDFAKSIEPRIVKNQAFVGIAKAFASIGFVQTALAIARSIDSKESNDFSLFGGTRDDAFLGIILSLASYGRDDQIIHSLEIVPLIEKIYTKDQAFLAIAKALSASGSYEKALGIAYSIQGMTEKNQALRGVVKGMVQSGSPDKINEAIRIALSMEDSYDVQKAFTAIAILLIKSGFKDRLELVLEEARQLSRRYEFGNTMDHVLSGAALALAEMGDWEAARDMAERIEKGHKRNEVLTRIQLSANGDGLESPEDWQEVYLTFTICNLEDI
ncbi:MAG: hypothetical protein EBZ47_03460 [Chlamydiae bacterium]|nr:hypothetical protein [Chlamydiota bacterium]